MRAIQVPVHGGPEVLELVELDDPEPGPRQVLVSASVAGVNYIDTHNRAGRYPTAVPFVPGLEGAGKVLAVGSEVTDFSPGVRVAWKLARASYAEQVLVVDWQAVPIPEGVSDETAAAVMLQGSTAHFLVNSTYPVQPGDMILVHAAAGGVGQLLTQIAKIEVAA